MAGSGKPDRNPDPGFYLIIDGAKNGPFTLAEVSQRLAAGKISGETQAWHSGRAGWEPLKAVLGSQEAAREEPPPLPLSSIPAISKPKGPSLSIPSAMRTRIVLAALALGLVIGLGWFLFFGQRASLENDEATSPSAAYAAWRQAYERFTAHPEEYINASAPAATVGWFDRVFRLPPEKAVLAALHRRLPPGVQLAGLRPVAWRGVGDEVSVDYVVTLRMGEAIDSVPVVQVAPQSSLGHAGMLLPKLVYADDLPSGRRYEPEAKQPVYAAGQAIVLTWTVSRASKADGTWRILEAAPIPIGASPRLEEQLIVENPLARVLRPEADIEMEAQKAGLALQNLQQNAAAIEQQVAQFRDSAMGDVPAHAVNLHGGAGSGTPTSAGIGFLCGAAGGAGIGGLAGGGNGAAIGAGAGAVVGGLIGLFAGAEHEKRERDRQEEARADAVRAAKARTATYEAGLWTQLDQQLTTAALAHDMELAKSAAQ